MLVPSVGVLVGKRRVPCRHHRPIRVIEVYTAYGESMNQLGALLLFLFFNGVSMASFVGCVAKSGMETCLLRERPACKASS